MTEVSVPFRGFMGLQACPYPFFSALREVFQSPSGVLGVCRAAFEDIETAKAELEFQSPSGVLGVCRMYIDAPSVEAMMVSVPFRGFRGLQVATYSGTASPARVVSVPFRGFRGLQEEAI